MYCLWFLSQLLFRRPRLSAAAMAECEGETAEAERRLAARCEALQWLRPRHLEMGAAERQCLNEVVVALARRELAAINRHRAPAAKLRCIVRTHAALEEALNEGPLVRTNHVLSSDRGSDVQRSAHCGSLRRLCSLLPFCLTDASLCAPTDAEVEVAPQWATARWVHPAASSAKRSPPPFIRPKPCCSFRPLQPARRRRRENRCLRQHGAGGVHPGIEGPLPTA